MSMIVVVTAFPVETIAFQKVHNGRALYSVALPYSFDGQVAVSLERHKAEGAEAWIARRLDDLAAKRGYEVVADLMASPLHLG